MRCAKHMRVPETCDECAYYGSGVELMPDVIGEYESIGFDGRMMGCTLLNVATLVGEMLGTSCPLVKKQLERDKMSLV